MGQIEVYEFLKNQRLCGCMAFFSCRAVERAFIDSNFSPGVVRGVRGDLLRLELSGYLEAKINPKRWVRCWRLKVKYVKL